MSDPYSRIFLLSHMRAYTSLLGHLLGSHAQINGYYEMHLDYPDETALTTQLAQYTQHDALKPGSHYLFDKLLHNKYTLSAACLSADTRLLMCLRGPTQTLPSIINLFRQKPESHRYAEPTEACGYYLDRLRTLRRFAEANAGRYCYFDAECLIENSDVMLQNLAQWLALETPLKQSYDLFSQSAKARKGDGSSKMKSGKITRDVSDYSSVELDDELLQQAQAEYAEVRRHLLQHAQDVLLMD